MRPAMCAELVGTRLCWLRRTANLCGAEQRLRFGTPVRAALREPWHGDSRL